MSLGTLLERTWTGLTSIIRPPTPAQLFRRADQYRHEGRYEEAAELITQGLRLAPNSGVGHLLAAYLHLVFREIGAAKNAFRRVLHIDPYHPRALFGLARIALEEGNYDECKPFLDRALQYYPDFPEAKALQEMVASWTQPHAPVRAPATPIQKERLRVPTGGRDLILVQTDGAPIFAQGPGERQRQLAQHMTQVFRIATATLARAGLSSLRRGVVERLGDLTVLRCDAGLVLSVTLPPATEIGAGLVQVGRIWTDLDIKP
ncbi:MAG TPA: tetratricopeptide repeat protein [Methylomirabilota bacterium]|nr:tetratricopeptide repeat protein [Methylomirabilota bacterium]